MKTKLFLLCFLNVVLLRANMASPVQEGTLGTRPFISEHVHIQHENLRITLGENFEYAVFEIEYYIKAEKSGTQIPLLFYASEYYKDFEVTIDGKKITLQSQEDFWDLYGADKEKLTNFHYLYSEDKKAIRHLENEFQYGRTDRISLNDFLYFETDIAEGMHKINVRYKATNWRYKHNRLNEDSFRYALAPAKYWKSFGTLNITIDASKVKDTITTNLGENNSKTSNGIINFRFEEMPVDIIRITRIPTLSSFAKVLLKLESFWLAILMISIFVLFHVWKMVRFRRKHPEKRISVVAIFGAIAIPIAFLFMLLLATFWIDAAIGNPYASGRESYGAFFGFMELPKYLIIYIVFSIIIDFIFKKIYTKT
ncbi:hypothetical protein [Kordia periserrulae]|nr:hypothetical protein [Kordia periserrulae]